MKIIVLMKQVANKDAILRVSGDEKWIDESNVSHQTNESDGYGLEEALRLKESKGEGEVVVCTLGAQSGENGFEGRVGARRGSGDSRRRRKRQPAFAVSNRQSDCGRDS